MPGAVPPWAASADVARRLDVDALRASVDEVLGRELYWFPIRHHSPAVARHLRDAIRARKPKVLFLEGPSEAAAMIPHVVDAKTKPPVAIYCSYRDDDNVLGLAGIESPAPDIPPRFASWYPMLPYSPEYVAMKEAKEVGTEVVFMDLPHYALVKPRPPGELKEEPASEEKPEETTVRLPGWEHLLAESSFYKMLAEVAGYRSWEEAWDSIFETGSRLADREAFRRELAYFCAAVRATTPPSLMLSDGTLERERHMQQTIESELARRKLSPSKAMVACGGFHLFLDPEDRTPPPVPPKGTVYVTVAPYSYFRTSELAGYAAGNRAPKWYQGLWENEPGSENSTVEHIVSVLARARKGGEPLSSADAIAAAQHARMLAALRARPEPVLDDVRDALVTCCCKGRPLEEGATLLRAMGTVEVGTAIGRVTPALGHLPLVHDFYAQIDALSLGEVMGKEKRLKLSLDRRNEADLRRSIFLHRLSHLEISLGKLAEVPAAAAGSLLFREVWSLQWSPQVEAALTEKVLYGDSVEAAAVAFLEEQISKDEVHAGRTCERLVRALDMDLPGVMARLEPAASSAIDTDKRFVSLAQALTQLQILRRHASFKQLRADVVDELTRRAFGHACFELPSAASVPEEEQEGVLAGLLGLAEALLGENAAGLDKALFVENVLKAREESTVPFLRGAFTGILSEIRQETPETMAARVAAFAQARPEVMIQAGEFLDGVLAVSRTSILLGAGALVGAVDELLRAAEWDAYLTMLPRLRHAFERLHERQRLSLCERVAEKYGLAEGAEAVATIATSAGAAAEIAAVDAKVAEIMKEWTF
jgi:hypothetical protein